MKMNEDARIDVISAISDEHIEAVTIERAEAKRRLRRRRITVGAVSALAACLLIIIQGVLLAVLGLPFGGRVPIYEGMTVSDVNPIETAYSYGYYKDTGADVAYLSSAKAGGKKPLGDGVKEHFGIEASELIHYAKPNEDIYITVKINNPDNYEILSFTLNGEKYSSYMFEDGSDMSNIVLKVNVGDVTGRISYTIDAIKYVDGDRIKDVRMDGERTVEIGIYNENQPTASVEDVNIGYDSLSFSAFVSDPDGILSLTEGKVYAVIYDGEELVKTELAVGIATPVSFEGLSPCAEYQYGIVATYDAYDGEGYVLHTLYENSFNNDPAVSITGMTLLVDTDTVLFNIQQYNGIGKLLRLEVVNEDGEVVQSSDTAVKKFENIPGGKHFIRVIYTYNNGTEQITAESESEKFLLSLDTYPVVGYIGTPYSESHPIYYPNLGEFRLHTGVDFLPSGNSLVYSVVGGCVVTKIYEEREYGLTVEVKDGDIGYTYLYQSLGEAAVKVGDVIDRGEVIGRVGSSSMYETGMLVDHLHFAVKDSGGSVIEPVFTGAKSHPTRVEKPVVGIMVIPYSESHPIYYPNLGEFRLHTGIDFRPTNGTLVYSVVDGVVTDIYEDLTYGLTVKVEDGKGYTYLYQSLGEATVKVGAIVDSGKQIGRAGSSSLYESGMIGNHLHFAVMDSEGNMIDPTLVIEFVEE